MALSRYRLCQVMVIAFVLHVETTYGFCLIIYMAAERLGIAETIPAYLNPKLKNEDLLKGVNFASGGSGYDPLTAKLVVFLISFKLS